MSTLQKVSNYSNLIGKAKSADGKSINDLFGFCHYLTCPGRTGALTSSRFPAVPAFENSRFGIIKASIVLEEEGDEGAWNDGCERLMRSSAL